MENGEPAGFIYAGAFESIVWLGGSLCIVGFYLAGCSNSTPAIRQYLEYDTRLKVAIERVDRGEKLDDADLLDLIPGTEDEFLTYYSQTFPGSTTSRTFNRIDSMIVDGAMRNPEVVLPKYMKLSSFVDGEYAEMYFEYVEAVAQKHPRLFCKTYNSGVGGEVERLAAVHADVCK